MVGRSGQDTPQPDAGNGRARLGAPWGEYMGRLDRDKSGLLSLATVSLVCLLLSAVLYVPLGLPARGLTSIGARIVDGSCAGDTSGFAYWLCGSWLSVVVTLGSLLIILALFLLRRQVRSQSQRLVQRLPDALHFLERPVVATLMFAMAWSGIQFHFFSRFGIIFDGLFPALIGILLFALTRWEPLLTKALGPAAGIRDGLPKVARIALLFAIPFLLAQLFTGWMPYTLRDQLIALIAVAVGWFMWAASPAGSAGPSRRRAKGTAVSLLLLVALALLLMVSLTVSAATPCNRQGWLTEDFFACEASHHNGTFAGVGAVIAIGTTAVVLAPPREEDDGPAEDVDPCAELQGTYDALRNEWMQLNDTAQTMERFIQKREEEYRIRNESTFWSQATDVAFMGAALPGGAPLAGSAMGRVFQAAGDALKPIVVAEILKKAMVEGGKTNAMEVAYAVINKTSSGAYGKQHEAVLQQLQKIMVEDMGEKLVARGVQKGSQQYASLMLKWSTDAQAVTEMVGGIAKVGGGAVGLWNMMGNYRSLKDFSDRIHKLRLHLIDKQGELDILSDKLRPAKNDLDNCRERVTMGLEP